MLWGGNMEQRYEGKHTTLLSLRGVGMLNFMNKSVL